LRAQGIAHIPSNDFSLYDHVLDMAVAVDAVPERYRRLEDPLQRYFALARGMQDGAVDLPALEMTKWFDTNYHYLVPELALDQCFRLNAKKLLGEIAEARALGIEPRPVVLGPVTFLKLSKFAARTPSSRHPLELLDRLLPIYEELLAVLHGQGIQWVQLDEPCLVLDLEDDERAAYERSLQTISSALARPRILVATYFGALGENLPLVLRSGLEAMHLDLVRAPEQLALALPQLPANMIVSLGLVDGRNVWRTDLDRAHALLRGAVTQLGPARVWVAPSCSLLHVPVDLGVETRLDPELTSWLAFAAQKLGEVGLLAKSAGAPELTGEKAELSRRALASRRESPRTRNPDVRSRLAALEATMLQRASPFVLRASQQRARFDLPLLPTTTIGSFPQTADVRAARASWRAGRTTALEYQHFLEQETRRCIERQEALGLDVLVHGEFERNDMVEYFGEQLEGFAFTEHGWVQSYGSRCVKPPILFGDVSRPAAMTVAWSSYAQSLTKRPMKGMLTGPVTILQWSFVRDDQARLLSCMQLALALRDEVADLEAAGIGMIQVDEPALREGLPLRRLEWKAYLRWAVDAFRLATSGVRDDTQVHTHMCYSEFGDILEAVAEMDADVVSIETSRSRMELLADFGRFRYPNDVGPGVYDIHSPRVPSASDMEALLLRAAEVLPPTRLWVNPDCGLKTRKWPEVELALSNMLSAARRARERLSSRSG
jgi:5-methyltetrahydropteroyltriglutamate--homocysteine methyltransferase